MCWHGNPNVGKSTVFNSLTGMHQHTGNWAGKTVANARGEYEFNKNTYEIIDLPRYIFAYVKFGRRGNCTKLYLF